MSNTTYSVAGGTASVMTEAWGVDLEKRVAALEAGTKPPVPQPPTESAEATTVPPGTQLVDALHNVFSIMAGQLGINGTADTKTANVTSLYYKAHQCLHQNTAGNWYAAAMSGGPPGGVATYTQVASPVPVTPPTGMFSVDVHGFKDGAGKPWRARGLNGGVQDALDGYGNVFKQFPAMAMYRLNTGSGNSDASIADVVQKYTSHGCVVLVEDHSGNRRDTVWYTRMATMFMGNNLVMLGVPNEPGGTVAADQIAVINAIKSTGYKGLIGLQCTGGYDYSNIDPVIQSCSMAQLFLTPHIYYAGTDPNGGQQYIDNDIGGATSRGLWCVFTEFGDGMDGWHRDMYGLKLVSSVIAAEKGGRCGALFWAMDNGNHTDGCCSAFLTRDGAQLTSTGVDPIKPWLST